VALRLSFRAVRRPIRSSALSLLLVALVCVGCGGSKGNGDATTDAGTTAAQSTASTPDTTASTATTDAGPCRRVAAPAPKAAGNLRKPKLKLDPSKTWTATVTTNCGAFTIKLDVKHDPKTAASFASLAEKGFYDDLVFHRIVPDFVIQGGDPLGDGTGGPGYSVVEPPPASTQYTHGVVAMAKRGAEPPGASGSQFFVVTGSDAGLPAEYAVAGKVTKGLDVVDAIGALPLQSTDPMGAAPVDPVVISSVKVHGG
jgi:peptidyl-prolyl cis-trans isomerase B (cyclophilin B)